MLVDRIQEAIMFVQGEHADANNGIVINYSDKEASKHVASLNN